jgi:hypothetical protein
MGMMVKGPNGAHGMFCLAPLASAIFGVICEEGFVHFSAWELAILRVDVRSGDPQR